MSDDAAAPAYHVPVLAEPILALGAGARRVVDGTLGHGGHAQRFLAAGAEVLGIDRDPDAIATASARCASPRLRTVTAAFDAPMALAAAAAFRPDVVLLDLGVSSRQLDDAGRGFTFRPGAPLDMRMGDEPRSAADWLNAAGEAELARAFADFGDEPKARGLAREVARRRARQPFATSDDLVNAIRAALGPRSGPGDFARLFQAVRIAVNRELEALEAALPAYRDALVPGGRLLVLTYHSGEDRIVKQAFRAWAGACTCPPGLPACACGAVALGTLDPRKPLMADDAEVAGNVRARSARLRGFRVAGRGAGGQEGSGM
ncbi:MAG: 16S rRNA (cytosine(1402)-N(4))-methyltransferase RsmH [Gemmatimonadales bacterium]|nr:16S rRNA (cytosine(1402)-N(4))-methyltransferase RsmH [Gemmatimonadales bacterium]